MFLIAAALAAAALACEQHSDCGANRYCDQQGWCYECALCSQFDDPVDGSCPPCTLDACTAHDDCTGDRFCNADGECTACAGCVDTASTVNGSACPAWCAAADTTVPAYTTGLAEETTAPATTAGETTLGADASSIERYAFTFEEAFTHVALNEAHLAAALESHLRTLARDDNLVVIRLTGKDDLTVELEATVAGAHRLQRIVALEGVDFVYLHATLGTVIMHELPASFASLGVPNDTPTGNSSGSDSSSTVGALAAIFGIVLVVAVAVGVYIFKRRAAGQPPARKANGPGARAHSPASRTLYLSGPGGSQELLIDDALPPVAPANDRRFSQISTSSDNDDMEDYIDVHPSLPDLRSEASINLRANAADDAEC